jgi:glycosyltransferase involved in cell wall biosynthesis
MSGAKLKSRSGQQDDIIRSIKLGRFTEAEEMLASLSADRPDDVTLLYMTGMLRGAQHRYFDAIQAFTRILTGQPGHAAANFELGIIEMMMCRFNRASHYFKRAKAQRYRPQETSVYLTQIKKTARTADITLSVCLIVKNEAQMLPACLRSVRAIADEIVVVDTGSDDDTVAIATSFGARVSDFKWQKDFSAARNFCREQASGDWILQLDADEEVFPEDQCKIREVIHQGMCDGAFLALHNRVSNSFGESQPSLHYLIRLYRNSPDIYYRNPVHEELQITGEVIPVDINILHHGYNLDPDYLRQKRQRNAEILYQKLEQDPDNVSTLFYLAMLHIGNHEYDQAETFAHRALANIPADARNRAHLQLMLMNNLAIIAVERGDCKTARTVSEQAIAINPDYLDAYYYLGLAHFNLDEMSSAIKAFEMFIDKSLQRQQTPVFALYADGSASLLYQAYHFLGKLYRKQERFQESLEMYSEAVTLNPQFWVCIIDIGYVYMDMQDWPQAAHFLDRGVKLAKTRPDVNKQNQSAWFDLNNAVKNYLLVLKRLHNDSKSSLAA